MPLIVSHRIAPVTFVGIDLGARRIGIATSDSGSLATPHSVLRNEGDVVSKVAALGAQLDAAMYVVGIARGAQQFRDFADALRQKTCKEVVLWNEELTTADAAELLRETGRKRREAQRDIDMYAAALILQSYLDETRRRQS